MTKQNLIAAIKAKGVQLTNRHRWMQWSEAEGQWLIYEAKGEFRKVTAVAAIANFDEAWEKLLEQEVSK